MIIKEQFYAVSEEELTLYLRERSPKGLDELVNLADLYLEARHRPKGESRHFSKDKIYPKPYQAKSRPNESGKSPNKPNSGKRPSGVDSNNDSVCYSCGKTGHISRFCPQRRSDGRSNRVDTVSSCQLVHDDNRFCCQHESGNNLLLVCVSFTIIGQP